MTETATKRHKWTKDELAHLNRTVSHSKKKIEAFQKVADEMGLESKAVAATYYNNRPKKAAKPAVKPASFKKSKAMPATSFSHLTETELHSLIDQVKSEIDRRAQTIKDLQAIWTR